MLPDRHNHHMGLIDVVVPCYNYARFLTQCVDSILMQTDVEVRVLIIDDASSDDTAVVAKALEMRDSRVTFRNHDFNRGNIETYNEGIEWARGDYFLLLSADDWLLPGALRRAATAFRAHPDVVLTCGKALVADQLHPVPGGPDVRDEYSYYIVPGQTFIENACSAAASPPVCTPTAIVRTSVQKQIGGYRKELPHAGDLDMWLRFARRGSVAVMDAYQAVYRKHDSNMHYSFANVANLAQHLLAFELAFDSDSETMKNVTRLTRQYTSAIAVSALRLAASALRKGALRLCLDSTLFAGSVAVKAVRTVL